MTKASETIPDTAQQDSAGDWMDNLSSEWDLARPLTWTDAERGYNADSMGGYYLVARLHANGFEARFSNQQDWIWCGLASYEDADQAKKACQERANAIARGLAK